MENTKVQTHHSHDFSHDFARLRDLVFVLTQKELRVRYKSYALGYVWSLMNPLVHAGLFYFVFQVVMKSQIPNYPVFLITGLFTWQWLANSLGVAPLNYLGNAPLIKKVHFPYILIPLVACLQDLIHFFISVPIILGLLIWFKIPVSPTIIWGLPLLAILQLTFAFFLSQIISTLNLFFRDLERIVALCLMFLFYATPVVYPATSVPEKFKWVLHYNPAALLMIAWRNLFLEGFVDFTIVGQFVLLIIPLILASLWVYKALRWRFAEVL